MATPGFSIIIVTWNGLHYLKDYLPSVVDTDYENFEIIIADNNSTDGTKEWLKAEYPEVIIAELDDNYGYCGGNNKAVPFANKEILLFLNNDVRIDKDWLKHLAPSFSDESVAAAQPKMLSLKEPEYFEYAGAAGGFLDKYGFPFCRGRVLDEVEKDMGQYDDETDIFWASGAALAIRKELFEELEGFDEDFTFHMEEIDLCWRLLNRGHRVVYNPKSIVYHLGGGSLPMGSYRKVYYNFRNNLRMLWKNYSTTSLITRFPIRYLLDVVAAYRSLLVGRPKEYWAIAMAHKDFLLGLSVFNRKRKIEIKARSQNSDPDALLPVNLTLNFFLLGKRTFKELAERL